MQNVFANLALTSVAASIASLMVINRMLPDASIVTMVLSMGSVFGITFLPERMTVPRHLLLYLFGFSNGWGIGPLLRETLYINPTIPTMALAGAGAIFLSFTMTAMMTERRSQLYLGGLLSSGMMALLVMGLLNSWFGSESLFSAEIYLGLLVFAGYVVYDTQVMIEVAEGGRTDVPRDSLNLFANLIGIFVRLLIIISKQKEQERERKRRKKD